MKYFVISDSEGDTFIDLVSEETLLKRLEEEYYGEDVKFKSSFGDSEELNQILIIKGEIVVPTPVKKVIKYRM